MKPSLARYVQFLLKSIDRRVLRQGCGGEFRLQSRDRVTPGSSQCYASSKRHPHRPSQRKVRRGSRRRVTGAPHSFFLSADHSSLGEIGQFQVIQKNAQKFVAGKNESECILLIVLQVPMAPPEFSSPSFGRSMRSPSTYSRLPGRITSRRLPRTCWKYGSLVPSAGIVTSPGLSKSPMARSRVASRTARSTISFARRRKR